MPLKHCTRQSVLCPSGRRTRHENFKVWILFSEGIDLTSIVVDDFSSQFLTDSSHAVCVLSIDRLRAKVTFPAIPSRPEHENSLHSKMPMESVI